jgi:two-component system sensor histidine kinase KdpD
MPFLSITRRSLCAFYLCFRQNSDQRDARGVSTPSNSSAPRIRQPQALRALLDFAWAAAVIALCTTLNWFLRGHANLAVLVTIYLLGLVGLAVIRGRMASAFGSVLGAICFDFFLESPPFTLAISQWPDFLVFVAQLAIAQLIAHLMDQQRTQTRLAQGRAEDMAALFTLSRALGQASNEADVCALATETLVRLLGDEVRIAHQPSAASNCIRISEEGQPSLWLIFPPQAAIHRAPEALAALAEQVKLSLSKARLFEAAQRAERAVELERNRSTLLAALGHDLRTPLAALSASASTLIDSGDALPREEAQELVRMVHQGAQQLNKLVEGLLEFTRLEGGNLELKGEWLPLEEVVGVVLTRLESAPSTQLVHLDLPPGLPLVFGDGLLLEELLTNLVSNALRHAPGHTVIVRARVQAGQFSLSVMDQGPGIPREDRERIFQKFIRLEGPSRYGDGLGLGLAICHAIVQLHHGRIWVEDGPDGGACFQVTLPQPALPSELGVEP